MSRRRRRNGQPAAPWHAYLVRPHAEPPEVTQLVTKGMKAIEQRGGGVTSIRMEQGRLAAGSGSRPIDLVPMYDATALYRQMHRRPVLVLAFGEGWVRRDPRRDPAVKRSAIALRRFTAYKALYGMVRTARDLEEHLTRLEEWRGSAACDGQDDPRILPLHVFETSDEWPSLAEPAAAEQFKRRYGPPSSRCDEGGKRWDRALARHGGPALTVAGCTLPAGTHWDVGIADGQASVATICTSDAVWELRGAGTYANVYPDSNVRQTRRSRGVRKVWP